MSVEIIGHRVDHEYGYGGWTGKKTDVDEVVATFDEEKDARRYIKDSRLKNPRDRERPFRSISLLSGFQDATIGEHDDNPCPHNPEIKKENK